MTRLGQLAQVAPRANSFNLVAVRDVPRRPHELCPLRSRATGVTDAQVTPRSFHLRLRDRMRLVSTRTADFTDGEIAATKARGQLYADVSDKLAPDDFARDLRKLRPSPECEACDAREGCARAWEAVPGGPGGEDVFTRDDAKLRAILRRIEGRVLDLGSGEGAHLGAFGPGAALTCVEPDEASARVLASRFPRARVVIGKAETIDARDTHDASLGVFDHALFVRSVNHLEDPVRAVGAALSVLAPGGTLLLCDNIAFGLVRTNGRADRAEAAPTNRFEHYRNDGADEALAIARAAARMDGRELEVIERHDVSPDTSNQWILHLR